jgi:hypothetical protein
MRVRLMATLEGRAAYPAEHRCNARFHTLSSTLVAARSSMRRTLVERPLLMVEETPEKTHTGPPAGLQPRSNAPS